MRVILKPVGLLLVLVAFAMLAWMVVIQSERVKASEALLHTAPAIVPTPSPVSSASPPAPNDLVNTGFEENYAPVVAYDNKGKISGQTASPWYDDSSWAPVTVDYEKDTQNPHSGASCQKISVTDVPTTTEARVQFVQRLTLTTNKPYRASCWLRADRPVVIDVALRQKEWPYRYYGVHQVKVDTTWQKQEVTGTPINGGETIFMLKVSKPVTFWVDDAAIAAE